MVRPRGSISVVSPLGGRPFWPRQAHSKILLPWLLPISPGFGRALNLGATVDWRIVCNRSSRLTYRTPEIGSSTVSTVIGPNTGTGPSQGLAANAALILSLTPKLLAAVDASTEPRFTQIDVCICLRAVSAKFWIREILSVLSSPTEDLDVQPWLDSARRGVQLARWGVCAPEVTQFEVKGALMDPYGNEIIPSRKIGRHYDIHQYGFS